jgi:hypothetical protein
VPTDGCLGFDDNQRRTPMCPHARPSNPEESVGCGATAGAPWRIVATGRSDNGAMISSCSAARDFRTDEAPVNRSMSHPNIRSTTLGSRCNFHDLSHFGVCERDSQLETTIEPTGITNQSPAPLCGPRRQMRY